jgi:replication-associated recombination protein RarA
MNLALKMRPQSFDDVIGQPETVKALKNHLSSGQHANGYIFAGPTGVGKTTLAEILAKELCQTDSPEIEKINCGDETGVDRIRKLISDSRYHPLQGNFKIYILNEGQKLTGAAQSALLDFLEETDLPVIVIITTTEISGLLQPLRDRCMSFNLKGIEGKDRAELVERTWNLTDTERALIPLMEFIEEYDITSGRAIINAVELYANGMSPREAVQSSESDPVYGEIATVALKGNWFYLFPKLLKMKAADAKGLRTAVSGQLRYLLLTEKQLSGSMIEAGVSLAKGLAVYTAFESGVDLTALTALLMEYCKKVKA